MEESCAAAVSQGGGGELETNESGRRQGGGLLNAPTLRKYPEMVRRLMEGFACLWTGYLFTCVGRRYSDVVGRESLAGKLPE